jgi:hypothetical protein
MVWIAAPVIVVLFTLISFSLRGSFNETGAAFQAPDQVAMILLGVLAAAGSLLLARPSVEADDDGVRVRNLFGTIDLPWALVRAVRFNRGAPWVTLDLHDDDVVSVLAIQAADKEHAVRAVRALRELHARHTGNQNPVPSVGGRRPPAPPQAGPDPGAGQE